MKIRYENTGDDIVAYRRHYHKHSPLMRKGMRLILFVPAALFLAAGAIAAIDRHDPEYIAGAGAIGFAWIALFWLLIRWRFRASERRLRRHAAAVNFCPKYELELTDTSLIERTDRGSHTTALPDVQTIASTETHTFIYVGAGAYVIPRRELSPEEYTAFVDAVRRACEQSGQLVWLPPGRGQPATSPDIIAPVAEPSAAAPPAAAYVSHKLASRLATCRGCGKSRPKGKLTCRLCGRTEWAAITIRFIFAVVLKAGALAGGGLLQSLFLSGLVAWGGSLLAGLIFLGAVGAVIDAFGARMARSRPSPQPSGDPALTAHAPNLVSSLFALALGIGFIIAGNPIGFVLGIWLTFLLGILALAVSWGAARAALLSAKTRPLAARMASRPDVWPIVAAPSEGILSADSGAAAGPAVPPQPVGQIPRGGEMVKLRVMCPAAPVVANLTAAVMLDGRLIGVGSLRRGFDARGTVNPGDHEIQVRWARVTERFLVHLPQPGAYEAELHYSWFWGKYLPVNSND